MPSVAWKVEWILLIVAVLYASARAQSPTLVPLDDQDATVAFLPAGISRNEPELFGTHAYIWALADGTNVIQYEGDFTLHLGQRRLESQGAVVWMQKNTWNQAIYYHFEVFLSRQARVRDSAGTVTTGPMLFVTFNSTQPANCEVDLSTQESSVHTKLYQEAATIRQAVRAEGQPPEEPQDMLVYEQEPKIPPRPRARPIVRHRADYEEYNEQQGVIIAIDNVYLSQGLVDSAEFLELRADAAVLFLLTRKEPEEGPETGFPEEPLAPDLEPFPASDEKARTAPDASRSLGFGEGLSAAISGAYLRGDVVLTQGERMIRTPELYFDFENDRALILDAVMRVMAPDRNLPIYVRAAQARRLSTTEYVARKASISTSEFHTPHVHIGAEQIHLTDATPRDETGRIIGLQAGKYRMKDVTLNLEGVPIAYWPYSAGDFRRSETSIRSVRFAYSDDFGATFQSKWYLFNLLGLDTPEGVDGLLRLDYFSKRGPGVGIDVDYELENAYGLFRGYYIHDTGEDNLGPFRDSEPDTENRGRLTFRHRQFLPQGWELTLEGSYISDPTFLEEYFNAEFEEGKEQETLIYLKKQKDNWAFTALAQWRVLDFLTQTEHFPDLGFHWIGEPAGGLGSFYSESHTGFVRYKPDNRMLFDKYGLWPGYYHNTVRSDITFRGDTRNEIDFPIKLGSANIVPYLTGRAGYWDSSPNDGSVDRLFGSAGVRTGTQFWRLFEDISSNLFDLNGIRHIIEPQVNAWISAADRNGYELFPFDDGIEDIDDFYGTSLALRQRWQTKRGGPGQWRTVDWIAFDVELNIFGNAPKDELPIGRFYDSRPEDSIARSHLKTDFIYRISDTTAILSDSNFDINDGSMDLFNVSYAVERTPRLSYFVGYRRIGDTDSNLVGVGANYEINKKHRVAVRTFYDCDRSKTEQFDITIVRKFPRWYAALTFGVDNIEEDIKVGLSIWPEGAPQAVLGARRYTDLSTSTGIRPE